jgi:hypothetical protein
MTDSSKRTGHRPSRLRPVAVLAVFALGLALGPALPATAQSDPVTPSSASASTPAANPALPGDGGNTAPDVIPGAGPDVAPQTVTPPDPRAVVVDTLAAPRAGNLGLVSLAGGGFPDSLWQGTPSDTATALVSALPRRYGVPAARDLAIRFLLSAAPLQQTTADTAGGQGAAMLNARIAALANMAAWDDALALSDLVPVAERSPDLMHVRINGLLAKNRVDAACSEGAQALALSTDVYWQKLQILCQFTTGQNAAAGVTLALLREQGEADKVFFWAVDVLQGNVTPPPADLMRGDGTIDPLILAILRRASYLLPEAVVKAGDPTVLMFAAQIALAPPPPPAPEPPPPPKPRKGKAGKAAKAVKKPPAVKPETQEELRLMTVERAVAAGVASPSDLRTAYGEVKLDADAASTDRIAVDTARKRAATYQLALAQNVPASRAEVVARVFDLTRSGDNSGPDMVTTALIYAPLIAGLPVSADLYWFAGTAAKALIVVDSLYAQHSNTRQPDNARLWVDLMQAAAGTSPDAAKASAQAWPYVRLSRPAAGAFSREELAAWQATVPAEPPSRPVAARAILLDLFSAVGESVTSTDWQPVMATATDESVMTGAAPPALLWNGLTLAAREGRLGETVALALRFLGADAGRPAPMAATKALEALATVGRVADARAVALQMALERGL